MLNEGENKQKGLLEHRSLLVFIWAAFPIVTLFGITLSSTSTINVDSTNGVSILSLCIAQILSVIMLLVLPSITLAYLYKKEVWSFFNLKEVPSLKMVLLVLGLIVSANLFLNLLIDLNALIPLPDGLAEKFQLMHDAAVNGQKNFLTFNNIFEFILVFFTISILPAITEEMYFRGVLMRTLLDMKIGFVHAIVISSFLFALIHFEFYYLLPIFFMGVILGYIYYRTKNLWLSILAHFFNNGFILILSGTNKIGITSIDLDANTPMYLSIIGVFLFMFIGYIFYQQTQKSKF